MKTKTPRSTGSESCPPSEETSCAVELRDVWKSFEGKEVLRGVTLSVRVGQTTVVIGRSGEGKSVLLKHVIGLLKPDKGSVVVYGEDISDKQEKNLTNVRERVGMLFQGSALFDSLNVRENVGFALDERRELQKEEIDQKVEDELARVGLPGIPGKMPSDLSGGMRKRVGLARTIVNRPQLILYDEPTTGLDPITADSINDMILQMQQELKVTSIVVTHDMASALKVGDRVALLHQGRIIFEGTPEEIQNTSNEYVRQFVEGRAEGPMTAGMAPGNNGSARQH
jgi:phospholipid/cholesterol/gamma-HCH transport system ATP-binding protein